MAKKTDENTDDKKSGRASLVESILRLKEISKLTDDGKSTEEISKELDISIGIVDRNRSYLKSLEIADLTKEDIAKKRSTLYIEMETVEAEVRKHLEVLENFDKKKYSTIKSYLELWKSIIESKAKMFGVLEIKTDLVINQQINTQSIKDELDGKSREAIAKAIIRNHEDNV